MTPCPSQQALFREEKGPSWSTSTKAEVQTSAAHQPSAGFPADLFYHRRGHLTRDTSPCPSAQARHNKPLGFYIRDGVSVRVTPQGVEKVPGVFISRLVKGGLAESTGLLGVNDEILEVNGIDVASNHWTRSPTWWWQTATTSSWQWNPSISETTRCIVQVKRLLATVQLAREAPPSHMTPPQSRLTERQPIQQQQQCGWGRQWRWYWPHPRERQPVDVHATPYD